MMVTLLAERFGLVCHQVAKDFDGYEIVVAKGAPKLAPTASDNSEKPIFRGRYEGNGVTGVIRYQFTRTSMALLTNRLSLMMRRRVHFVDRTGITGRFDFTLEVEAAGSSGDVDASSISNALERQLGLKLNRVKVPLGVLVVDHAERVPTEN